MDDLGISAHFGEKDLGIFCFFAESSEVATHYQYLLKGSDTQR